MAAPNLNRAIGAQRNKLLRYQRIKELYNESIKLHPHTPLTKILEIHIFPIYPISRTTLYAILCTSITSELKALEVLENTIPVQQKLFN